jgi:RNA polymerase sigma-70 factor (ECF subfamily)
VIEAATVGANAGGLEDPEAFRAFYVAALPRVYGYLFLRCGADTAAAEDLTQETFLAAAAELRRGRAIVAPLPWIIGIARHKLLDHYRRQRRAGWSVLSWEEARVEDTAPEPMPDDGAGEGVAAALAAVPSPQREALMLRYLDGYSVPDVAAALGRSVEAAESLLARGKASFRRAYREARDGE